MTSKKLESTPTKIPPADPTDGRCVSGFVGRPLLEFIYSTLEFACRSPPTPTLRRPPPPPPPGPAGKDCSSRHRHRSERAEKDCSSRWTVDTAMDITTKILQGALLNAQHQDDKIRSVAEGKLKELQDENLPNFLLSLAAELSSDASQPECKRLAGIMLKELLDERCSADGDQWINLDQLIKFKIKESLLVALGSLVPDARHASSQVIAKVAYIEIPRREWPDLIGKLLANMAQQGASPPLKQGTLEALGYVIEILGLNPDELNDVLNVVIEAMNQAELSSEVCLAVVKVIQYVLKHGNFSDWQSREAAISALGIILEGPSIEELAPMVGLLMGRMEDPILQVRVTAARTLGRAFKLLHSPALGNRIFANEDLRGIMAVLTKSSKDVPEVSEEVCRAIYFLARGYESTSSELGHSKKKISSELSPFLGAVIDELFSASELAKETPFRLPASESAYEALSEVVRVSNMQDYPSVAIRGLMPRVMRRLNMVLDTEASSLDDKRNKYDLLVLLCGVLHVIIQKLATSPAAARTVTESARYLLLLFCRVLTCKCSTARDKAALAIGALTDVTGPDFVDHMPILLQYFNVERLFPIYLQVIGNIFHVLGERTLPYCDDIMDVLYKGLSKSELKSPILECFGVIALAIGKNFEKYLQAVMKRLKQAANPRYYANVFDEDKVDYGNQLIQAILKAYSGILRGIKDPISGLKVATGLFEFTKAVCMDQRRSAIVKACAVDVLSEFGSMAESWSKGLISEVTK